MAPLPASREGALQVTAYSGRRPSSPQRRPAAALAAAVPAPAAPAAAAPRRPSVPRVRVGASARETLYTQDVGVGPSASATTATAQEGSTKRMPFSLESVLPPVPKSFKCPITQEVMRDPVMTQDGHVYENESIQEWFRRGHRTSPVTGAELTNLALLPEIPLRRAIEEYMALRPEIARRELNLRSDLLSSRNVIAALEEELQAKKRLLSNLDSSQCALLAERPTTQESSCTPSSLANEQYRAKLEHRMEYGGAEASSLEKQYGAGRGGALPPVLAGLPTPCRDGGRSVKQPSAPDAQDTSQSAGRTTMLQELKKAMRWRSTRASSARRPSTSR